MHGSVLSQELRIAVAATRAYLRNSLQLTWRRLVGRHQGPSRRLAPVDDLIEDFGRYACDWRPLD
jgi:hypothetical protein